MQNRIIGQVKRVDGPVVIASKITDARMMELVYIGDIGLVGEIIKLEEDRATIQVYEDTTGIAPLDNVYGSRGPLSVELGPGLIGSIYDGIQRPLEELRALSGDFIARGQKAAPISHSRLWSFTPAVKAGSRIKGGDVIGKVPENDNIVHFVMAPPLMKEGIVTFVEESGDYDADHVLARVQGDDGDESITMCQKWPIRTPRPMKSRLPLEVPLITGQRVIDTLFPLAKGGTVAIPGGFGTGKTMTQHAIASWCDADIIVYIGCGERGNEMTDVLKEFPQIMDPRTGRSLMERTILIANTSNMPVSAREASIYTGISIAEYYRDMGYHIAIMADSTSRWAEALRELSGRMEEMPAEEGFPAYLPTRISEFYERAGMTENLNGTTGSVSVIGAVSPPGGDFSEPVTQHTKRFVRCFWGLDKALASARHYPAISWLDSYSEYVQDVQEWWDKASGGQWSHDRQEIMELLQKEVKLQQVVKLVGADALPDSQNFILEVCKMFKVAFLQQNAFDDMDKYCEVERQVKMLRMIIRYYELGSEAIKGNVTLVKIRRIKAVQDLARMRNVEDLDSLQARLEHSIKQLGELYE